MIHFDPTPEPHDFDDKVRRPGLKWLEENLGYSGRPHDYWSQCKTSLGEAFRWLCAYSCMRDLVGTLDHYISCRTCLDRGTPEQIYEWGNYRYVSAWLNSSKQNEDDKVLDPFEVRDGWFEIILPSLQLRVVEENVPRDKLDRAKYTLKRLNLEHDERIIRQRKVWYDMYQSGELPLAGLMAVAPLLARAVEANGS